MRWTVNRRAFAFFGAVAVAAVGLQLFATIETTEQAREVVRSIETMKAQDLADAKIRHEIVELRIRNELNSIFLRHLISGLLPIATALVAIVGGWVGLKRYLDARETERIDRAASDLNEVLKGLAAEDARTRTVGLVALQHFFRPDKAEYHLRALAALATAARMETDREVLRTLRICAEQAFANVDPALLRDVSWQGVKLGGVDLAGRDMNGLDLRDADLEDAVLTGARLTGAVLTNARLNGARLDKAELPGADLSYTDFAGASLRHADLTGARLRNARVWRMDLDGAVLRGADFDPAAISWELVRNWRRATLDDSLMADLLRRYGPEPTGVRVLMLMWEMPPLVAGGTWTACYHLVRNLRRRGADVVVAVPWDEASILPAPFGSEVEVVAMGIAPPLETASPYGSPYGGAAAAPPWSPYAGFGGRQYWSPYQRTGYEAYLSAYAHMMAPPWSPYAGTGSGRPSPRPTDLQAAGAGTTLLRLTEDFAARAARFAARNGFALVHAHDWVTFAAAERIRQRTGVPWIAHFHSCEIQRRAASPDSVIQELERTAAAAARVVVPGRGTADAVRGSYGFPDEGIVVLPNGLSPNGALLADTGRFESKRVVFLGRLSPQKGPMRFADVAAAVRRRDPHVGFFAYGEGELAAALRQAGHVRVLDRLEWTARGAAFRGATALVVPSRSEPFGMVVLEGMQHRVPVLYPATAGAAEVLESGIRIDPADTQAVAARLLDLLADRARWEHVVEAQAQEIEAYPERGFEKALMKLWAEVAGARQQAAAGARGAS